MALYHWNVIKYDKVNKNRQEQQIDDTIGFHIFFPWCMFDWSYCVSFISNGFNRFLITLTPVFYKGYLQASTLFEGRKFIDGSKYFEGLRVDSVEPLW